ncbi:exonuclease domain-containing protein [Ureibacillus sinduriensis]|uniref:Exonuclease n=1 Tax=Ureibacillus sinduriensis BLB-1 = JCM 15800 TaxID=1384057 RepID=A0A0A3HWH1_9BACL|nr:exonuclease domain-containing protein [Ureibacillus sinduriensis]KGR74693.1 exonuclease [Ureibacillus sinduriensis BLB-1 = JCM 15800]
MAFEPFLQLLRGIQAKRGHGGVGGIQNSHQMAYLRHLRKEIDKESAMNTPLDKLNVVIFDIETTGFSPERGDSILSIGAIKMVGTKILEEQQFYSLIYVEQEIPEYITNLTGITSDAVSKAPTISNVLLDFFEFVQDSTLVAHHATHERGFMQHASSKFLKTPFKHRIVDTSFLYKLVARDFHNMPLEQLCARNSIPVVDRHHALGDAKMTAQIWSVYLKKVMELGCESLNDVYNLYSRI